LHIIWGTPGPAAPVCHLPSWLWQGYLARGAITLLIGPWRTGLTTLASLVLARLKTGGRLAGLPVAVGRAVVLSGEVADVWHHRTQRLDLGDQVGWLCQPFPGRPVKPEWLALLDGIAAVHAERGLALVVIDFLEEFLPIGGTNAAVALREMLASLRPLARRGLSVLILHHPHPYRFLPGPAGRDSAGWSDYVDVRVEMRSLPHAAFGDRHRRLWARSRFEGTPPRLLMELDPAGADYDVLGPDHEEDGHRRDLWRVLESAPRKLTRAEVHRAWPGRKGCAATSLRRWLERGLAEGTVCRDGSGQQGAPFRYWLLGQEERWARESAGAPGPQEAPRDRAGY
jgi:hypothetical protein